MSSQLGIDKLRLLLHADEVSFRPDFEIQVENPHNAGTGEYDRERQLFWNGERFVMGTKAYLNTKDFQMVVKPHREGGSSLVLVTISGAAYTSNNLEPLGLDATFHASRGLEKDLLERGCKFDVMKAQITRLDVARNIELTRAVDSYSPSWALMNCRKRVHKVDHGGTGFYAGNKQWEAGFYDKGLEMQEKGIELAECPQNTLRAEMRYLKSGTVRDATGCHSLADLKHGWSQLKPSYIASLERDIFRAKTEVNLDRSIALNALAKVVRKSGVKRTSGAFHQQLGVMQLVMLVGPEEAAHFMAEEFGYDTSTDAGRKQMQRLRETYQAADTSLKASENTTSGALVKELYRELQERVLKF